MLGIADLNGDRKPDLATANATADTVSVLLNRGDGRFAPRRDYPTDVFPDTLEIADLNHDGKPDLTISYYRDNAVSVLLNRGNGGFLPRADYRTGGVDVPIAIADLNGDRRPDLVNAYGDSLFVLINKPGVCNVQRVTGMVLAAAKRELARVNCRVGKVISYSTRVRRGGVISQRPRFGAVLRGGGRSTSSSAAGRRIVTKLLALASLLAPRGSLGVAALRASSGAFVRSREELRNRTRPASVAIGDLNGDGKPDLATAN